MQQITLKIKNKEGLHARPAALFVNLASGFQSDIKVIKNGDHTKEFEAKSIISVMMMAAGVDDEITIIADGEDEALAVEKLKLLLEQDE